MTTFSIALSLALGLVSIAIQNVFPPREFTWRHAPVRPLLAAQLVLALVLAAGGLWSEDPQFALLLLAGWTGGHVIGMVIAALRSRRTGTLGTEAAASSAPAR